VEWDSFLVLCGMLTVASIVLWLVRLHLWAYPAICVAMFVIHTGMGGVIGETKRTGAELFAGATAVTLAAHMVHLYCNGSNRKDKNDKTAMQSWDTTGNRKQGD
jgi:hypothetical protein